MRPLLAFPLSTLLLRSLSDCSYVYEIVAKGTVDAPVFALAQSWSQRPQCLRQVEVRDIGANAVVWHEHVDYDSDCPARFPLRYGTRLEGKPIDTDLWVEAMPLASGVIYEVTTVSEGSGYGATRFRIDTQGKVVDLSSAPRDEA